MPLATTHERRARSLKATVPCHSRWGKWSWRRPPSHAGCRARAGCGQVSSVSRDLDSSTAITFAGIFPGPAPGTARDARSALEPSGPGRSLRHNPLLRPHRTSRPQAETAPLVPKRESWCPGRFWLNHAVERPLLEAPRASSWLPQPMGQTTPRRDPIAPRRRGLRKVLPTQTSGSRSLKRESMVSSPSSC